MNTSSLKTPKFHPQGRLFRSLRRWAIALVLGIIFVTATTAPALALSGSSSTSPKEGEVSLTQIEQKSKEALKKGPRGMEEVQSRAQGGLNGVQGSANSTKMETPYDSDSTTVMDDVKNLLKGDKD